MIFFIHLQLKINSTISQDTKSNANIHHREVSVCFIWQLEISTSKVQTEILQQ